MLAFERFATKIDIVSCGRDTRRSTDRPTRAGSLSAPRGRLLRLRPSAANSRRHQRPGAPSAAARPALRSMFPPTPLTLGSRRWHKLNSAPRAETDQRRSRQARAARRPQLPHALRRAEWPLPGRRQSAAGQAMKCRSGSTAVAHRTGLADCPHSVLGQDFTPSPTTGHEYTWSHVLSWRNHQGDHLGDSERTSKQQGQCSPPAQGGARVSRPLEQVPRRLCHRLPPGVRNLRRLAHCSR